MPTPGPNVIQSIAVLPFVDENPGEDAEFLDDSIAESLGEQFDQIVARSCESCRAAVWRVTKARMVDPRKVGKELNVRAVVTGPRAPAWRHHQHSG